MVFAVRSQENKHFTAKYKNVQNSLKLGQALEIKKRRSNSESAPHD